jgi:hypothetical protein
MYNSDKLIAHAYRRGVEVSPSQIRVWKRDGLLPRPLRAAMPGQSKGGIEDQYPVSALPAVVWLGKHRERIGKQRPKADKVLVTKFLMWVDGKGMFDYVEVDKDELIMELCRQEWRVAQALNDELPDIDQAHTIPSRLHGIINEGEEDLILDEDLQDRILNGFDVNLTSKNLDNSTGPIGATTLYAASLGIFFGEEDQILDIVDKDLLTGSEADKSTNIPAYYRDRSIVNVYGIAKGHLINWQELRKMWTGTKVYLFNSHEPLVEIKYDPMAIVKFYCQRWMDQAAQIIPPVLEAMEELKSDESERPEDEDARNILRARFRETARFYQQNGGFVPTHRTQLDEALQRIIETYGNTDA